MGSRERQLGSNCFISRSNPTGLFISPCKRGFSDIADSANVHTITIYAYKRTEMTYKMHNVTHNRMSQFPCCAGTQCKMAASI